MIESGVEMATSTADIPQASEINTDRPKSGSEDLHVSMDLKNSEEEINPSVLQTGSFINSHKICLINY